MPILLGAMTAAGGLFLYLWYRTVVSLPVRKQPAFIHGTVFKWGIPSLSLILFAAGLLLLYEVSAWLAAGTLGVGALLSYLVVKFDRYTAEMRIINDYYRKVRDANAEMDEIEVLYLTAQWRNPGWSHDRLVELVAGKDLESLILLMILNENKINPISDWELYRSLKAKAASIVRT